MFRKNLFIIILYCLFFPPVAIGVPGYLFIGSQTLEGPVAKYSFNNGNANDEVGANHGKVYNVWLDRDRFGNPNSAYYFHGNNESYINLGSSNALKPKAGTISLWVNINDVLGIGSGVETNPFIYTRHSSAGSSNDAYYIGMDLNTKKLTGMVSFSEQFGVTVFSNSSISIAKWHHVAISYNNKELCLYVDGELQDCISKKFETTFLQGDSVLIGKKESGNDARFLLGNVDDISIYKRVLSPAEIKELYNAPDPNRPQKILVEISYIVGAIILAVLIIFTIKRYISGRIKKEKEKNRLLNKAYEQEIRVLTAQMDPHFIFNFLNTIQQFIITSENEKAELYLTKFSLLISKILETNSRQSINLMEEIEIFKKYLEIESLRFNNVFNYEVNVDKHLDSTNIQIPHFLLQPLIENAIWHGLLPKKGDKKLSISFEKLNENSLLCIVEDNGIGRKNSKRVEYTDKKSLALNFIEQRLQLLGKMRGEKYTLVIIDKEDKDSKSLGTKVVITLPILNK
jgi:hypothetical protein